MACHPDLFFNLPKDSTFKITGHSFLAKIGDRFVVLDPSWPLTQNWRKEDRICISTPPRGVISYASHTHLHHLLQSLYLQRWTSTVLDKWYSTNNLELNALKTVEMTIDFRKEPALIPHMTLHWPLQSPFCFLGTTQGYYTSSTPSLKRVYGDFISRGSWRSITSQWGSWWTFTQPLLNHFVHSQSWSGLLQLLQGQDQAATCHLLCWEGNRLQLPIATELYVSRAQTSATSIVADPSHLGHALFQPLPYGKRLWSIKTGTSCLKNRFFSPLQSTCWKMPVSVRWPPTHTQTVTFTSLSCLTHFQLCTTILIL